MTYPDIRHLFRVKNSSEDLSRREFILYVLLAGLCIVSLIALLASIVNLADRVFMNGLMSLAITITFFVVTIVLWWLVRIGHIILVTYVLLLFMTASAVWLLLQWSFELPIGVLSMALVLVMSGVLLRATAALRFSIAGLILFITLCSAQLLRWLHPHTAWLKQPLLTGDAIGYTTILCIIVLVSWLANREIDRSLLRARTSEVALQRERDTLEIKVKERTRQLEKTQQARLSELQRFAEFGRLSANLLHEVANPLTAASLNVEQLEAERHSQLSIHIRQNLRRIERYVAAARQQLVGNVEHKPFQINQELTHLVKGLESQAKQANVRLKIISIASIRLMGDPVKFNQIFRNLIVNAIEAYPNDNHSNNNRLVDISVEQLKGVLVGGVRDYGRGISSSERKKIFDPFYTTKQNDLNNLGIGLSMIKRYVEEDFGGHITVTSSPRTGTLFNVMLPIQSKKGVR